jgi:hypothetical protein
MKKNNIFIFLIIVIYGCTPPPISILFLSNNDYDDFLIDVNGEAYFLECAYSLEEFPKRLEDSLISSFEITLNNQETFDYDLVEIRNDSIYCKNDLENKKHSLFELEEIIIYRKTNKEDIESGLIQYTMWPLVGFLLDISKEKSGSYTGTIIGGAIGLISGSMFIFDNNKFYERVYIKK